MNQSELLEKEIHIRIPQELEHRLTEIAASYNLKKSAFARIILHRHLNDYVRNRMWG
jgi:hypothetical protein